MTFNDTTRGIAHLLPADHLSRAERELSLLFVDFFSTVGQLHDDARELEQAVSRLLYGTDTDSFAKRLITRAAA